MSLFFTEYLNAGLPWGSILGNLCISVHLLGGLMHFGVFGHLLLHPPPPHLLLTVLLCVLGKAGLTLINGIAQPPSSLALREGLANGKHQQEVGRKERELGYSTLFPSCSRMSFWQWLCPSVPSQRHFKFHRNICICFLGLLLMAYHKQGSLKQQKCIP